MRSATSSSRALRAAAVAGALGLAALGCAGPDDRPSLLVVTLDTLRADHVGAYGGDPELTPHLDALAREGLVHEAAYTTMPTTGPAHVSLFTGLPPRRHGSDRNGVPMDPGLRPRELAARLREAGYATAAFVTTPILARARTGLAGFEIYDEPATLLRPGRDAAAAALRWLDAEQRRPVLIWVHLYDPHAPYGDPDEKRRGLPLPPGAYGWVDAGRYAGEPARQARAEAYARGVHEADAVLGELVAGVRARLETAPLVVAVADHGESLDEHLATRRWGFDHGEYLDVEAVRIPLVIAGPDVAPGRSPGPVSIRDLYGTLLQAAGLGDPDAAAEGRRDLRAPSGAPRTVVIERRSYAGEALDAPDAEAAGSVRGHAVAAHDGHGWAIVGESGAATATGGAGAAPLVDVASAVLAERLRAGPRPAPAFDAATAEALRALGYAP